MWLSIVIYILTGIAAPLLVTWVTIGGGCDPKTAFFVIPSYVGMGLTNCLIPSRDEEHISESEPLLWLLCFIDLLYGLASFCALLISGPSVFLFGSSASLLYLAAAYKLIFGRKLTKKAWFALLLISIGLCFSANFSFAMLAPSVSLHHGNNFDSSVDTSTDHVTSNAVGLLFASFASLMHSLSTLLLEFLLVEKRLSASTISTRIGRVGVLVYGCWTAYYTLPDFTNKVRGPEKEPMYQIILVFFVLIFNSLFHALTMMSVVATLGGTSTGVIKVVLGVCVFTMGHLLFCSPLEKEECFTAGKAISSLLTSLGIILYLNEVRQITSEFIELKNDPLCETKE